jgi:hypothetical protein
LDHLYYLTLWPTCSLFVWLVANGWCWFVLREKYCWLVCGWFALREKYCWLVADKPSEQGDASNLDKKSQLWMVKLVQWYRI